MLYINGANIIIDEDIGIVDIKGLSLLLWDFPNISDIISIISGVNVSVIQTNNTVVIGDKLKIFIIIIIIDITIIGIYIIGSNDII